MVIKAHNNVHVLNRVEPTQIAAQQQTVVVDDYADLFADLDEPAHLSPVMNPALIDHVETPESIASIVEAELTLFLAEPAIKRLERNTAGTFSVNDPLQWWKMKEVRFPIIAKIARDILCIPATSAPSERLFSAAGLTIAADRARLLPDNAAMLIFLHENWAAANTWLAARNLPLI